jgi:hypothetical protein
MKTWFKGLDPAEPMIDINKPDDQSVHIPLGEENAGTR